MKVVLVCTGLNDLGGPNRHMISIYKYLMQKGNEVYIICCSLVEIQLRDFFFSMGAKAEHLRFIPSWQKRLFVPIVFSLSRLFKTIDPDVVHSFGIQSDIFCGLATKFSPIKKMCGYYESWPLTANSGRLKNIFYRVMNRLVKDQFWQSVAVSEDIKSILVKMKLRCVEKVKVIYLGIEPFSGLIDFPKRVERLLLEGPIIGAIARFSPEKGLDRFLRAAALVREKMPKARFVLVGDGPHKYELMILARQLGLEDITEFRGWTSNQLLEMQRFDLFVMPSLREGCPAALLEALSVGCPIIASDIPGINEIIRHQHSGILVNTASADEFAKAMIAACSTPQETIKLAQNGYHRVRMEFTMQKEIDSLLSIYQ